MSRQDIRYAVDQFRTAFAIGTVLNPTEFDAWAQKCGLLNTPSDGAAKQSDVWLAHLQRRHQLRYQMNRLAASPKPGPDSPAPFTVDAVAPEIYEVRTPATAISQSKMTRQISSLVITKRRQLARLQASADWDVLPAHERIFAESLYGEIDDFAAVVHLQANQLSRRFAQLQQKLQHALETGHVRPVNHGIQAVLALTEANGEDTNEAESDG